MFKTEYISDDYSIDCAAVWSDKLQHTYMHCIVKLKKDMSECRIVKEKVEGILEDYEAEYLSYTRIDAYKEGKSDIDDCHRYAADIFGRLGASQVCSASDNIYTEYGYSKEIDEQIETDNKKVNVQISFSYNEEKDVTDICVGTPIINTSY